MASPLTRICTIELTESEKIVSFGVAKRTWLVNLDGRLTPARLVPGARVDQRRPEPGIVWSRSIALQLPVGTRLELVQEVPRPRHRADTFSILTLDQKSPTLRRITPHEVTLKGLIAIVKR